MTQYFHGEHLLGGGGLMGLGVRLPRKSLKTRCYDINSGVFWAASRL